MKCNNLDWEITVLSYYHHCQSKIVCVGFMTSCESITKWKSYQCLITFKILNVFTSHLTMV